MKIRIVCLTVLLTVGGCASENLDKDYQKDQIPKAVKPSGKEIANTKRLLDKSFKGKVKMTQSGSAYNRTKTMVRRLSRAAGLGGWSYPVYIADAGKEVNAMAVNDNTIVVYKQLITNVGSDNGLLATVLGHEVSHMLARHGHDTTSKTRTAGVAILAEVLGAVVAARTGNAQTGAVVRDIGGAVGVGVLVRPYDRSMELEADHVGMLLMAKAGYNPRSAIRFWNNSRKYLGHSGSNSFLSTHPGSGNRKARLQETLPLALKYYRR